MSLLSTEEPSMLTENSQRLRVQLGSCENCPFPHPVGEGKVGTRWCAKDIIDPKGGWGNELVEPGDQMEDVAVSKHEQTLLCIAADDLVRVLGHKKEDLLWACFEPVDDYHLNCAYLKVRGRRNYVIKVLDRNRWDTNPERILNEEKVGAFAADINPNLGARKITHFHTEAYENGRGLPPVVYYPYLGEAMTGCEKDARVLKEAIPAILNELSVMHLNTISTGYGTSLDVSERVSGDNIAGNEIKYLVNDAKRHKLPNAGEIERVINERWVPALNDQGRFCLTHADLTLSNILRSGDKFTLIDWTYAGWNNPSIDVSALTLWLVRAGDVAAAKQVFAEITPRYQEAGLDIAAMTPLYVARRTIGWAKFISPVWGPASEKILNSRTADEVFDIVDETVRKERLQ